MERALASSDGSKKPILLRLVLVGKLGVGKSGVNALIPRDRVLALSKAYSSCCVYLIMLIAFVFHTLSLMCVFF